MDLSHSSLLTVLDYKTLSKELQQIQKHVEMGEFPFSAKSVLSAGTRICKAAKCMFLCLYNRCLHNNAADVMTL